MDIFNKQFLERMPQEKDALNELVKIFKNHPELRYGTSASNYDPFAPHYVLTDQVSYHLSQGKVPLLAVQAAYADIELLGFPEAIRQVKKTVQEELEEKRLRAELDAVTNEMADRHPEFNRNDPRFSQALIDQAVTRAEAYIDRGMEPANALRQAVTDMESEARQPKPQTSMTGKSMAQTYTGTGGKTTNNWYETQEYKDSQIRAAKDNEWLRTLQRWNAE